MTAIGASAAKGQSPSEELLAEVRSLTARDPLNPAPFLVEGTRALSQGDEVLARSLLEESLRRDPRSSAVRFLLADLYLRTARIADGLEQISVLARLVPGGLGPLAPALAAYAAEPGAADRLRGIFRVDPIMRKEVLNRLASDPANADLVLELARAPGERLPGETGEWQERLVQGLFARGDYRRAYRTWSSLNPGVWPGRPTLFNPNFAPNPAPPPFDWSLESGRAGLAEPTGDGALQIIFYGREDSVLASQTMLLDPGQYRLSARIEGDLRQPPGLGWRMTCLPDRRVIATVPLAAGVSVLGFTVPPSGCPAQRLDIAGRGRELPMTVEATLGELRLQRGAKR